jgi:hypothetical protein
MTDEQVWHSVKAPKDLPTLGDIVKSCASAGFNRNGVGIKVAGKPRFWVKYGLSVTRGEGLTQTHVARIVNTDPVRVVRVPEVYLVFSRKRWGYIVMEDVEVKTFAQRKLETGQYGEDHMEAPLLPPFSGSPTSKCLRAPPPAPLVADASGTTSSSTTCQRSCTPQSGISRIT